VNAEALLVRLAWALVHFLWQGALLGVVAWGGLALLRRRRPEVRYAAACLFLGGCLALPLLTFLVQGMPAVMPTAEVARTAGYQAVMSLRRLVVGHLPLLLGLWGLGSLILGLRAGASWLWLARLHRRATEVVDAQVLHLLERLEARLGLTRPVRLMASERVRGPFVHGLWRPIVFVPVGFVTGLDPKALEAVLAHELAHVRRLDVLVIGLQTVIETLLYYHPVTWWLSHRVSTEREHCCDAFAVEACGDPVLLAKTLSRFADLAQAGAPALAGGDLMERIQRLLQRDPGPGRFPTPMLSAGLALTATVLVARQPEVQELVRRLPAQMEQASMEVQGAALAIQQPVPEQIAASTIHDALRPELHEVVLAEPEQTGLPLPQAGEPERVVDPAVLPSSVWLDGDRAQAAAKRFHKPLVLAVTQTDAQKGEVLKHLNTLAGTESRFQAEFWLASPGDAEATKVLARHQILGLPAVLILDLEGSPTLRGARVGAEATAWASTLTDLLEGKVPLCTDSIRAWAGNTTDPAAFYAFARARKAFPDAGGTEPHVTWLRGLIQMRTDSVRDWALTRLVEAGGLEPFAGLNPLKEFIALRDRLFEEEVLLGNRGSRHPSRRGKVPSALGEVGEVSPKSPMWDVIRRELRRNEGQVISRSVYALMAPVLERNDRDWVFRQVQKSVQEDAKEPETHPTYWIAMDWLMCYGNAQDWEAFQAAIEPSWREPMRSVRKGLDRISAFWQPLDAQQRSIFTDDEAFWTNPTPTLDAIGATREDLIQLGAQRMVLVKRHAGFSDFPKRAFRPGLSGTLRLSILIDAMGKVQALRPKPGYALWALGASGLVYASGCVFEPAKLAGKGAPALFQMQMPFMN